MFALPPFFRCEMHDTSMFEGQASALQNNVFLQTKCLFAGMHAKSHVYYVYLYTYTLYGIYMTYIFLSSYPLYSYEYDYMYICIHSTDSISPFNTR